MQYLQKRFYEYQVSMNIGKSDCAFVNEFIIVHANSLTL